MSTVNIKSWDELSNVLALKAVEEINQPKFVVNACLDIDKPETLRNFKLLGDQLVKAYKLGALAMASDTNPHTPQLGGRGSGDFVVNDALLADLLSGTDPR